MKQDRILVVDDYPANVLLLSKILQKNGFEVVSTTKSNEVLDMVGNNNPGLILLDIMMPTTDGIELLQMLKNSAKYKHIPVIIVSAKTDNGVIEKAQELGAVEYIKKPISIVQLLKTVNQTLKVQNVLN